MATRMQQRRGTEAQWTASDPILNIGEIGFESDSNKFKIGDGVNHWADLAYFLDADTIGTSLDGYIPDSLLGVPDGVAQLNASGKLVSDQIPNIDEITVDAVDAALVAGTGITKSYDDAGDTLTISVTSNTYDAFGSAAAITASSIGLGNVDNTSDANKPVSTSTQTALDAKLASADAATTYAPLASPALTGTPTAPTADAGTNTTQVATTAYVRTEVAALVDSAPGALDTLNELAAALGDDASFSTTVTNALGEKAPLASPIFTGTVDFTGATVTGISSYNAPTLGSTSIASGATVTTISGLTDIVLNGPGSIADELALILMGAL